MSKYLRLFIAVALLAGCLSAGAHSAYAACNGDGVNVSGALGAPGNCVGGNGVNPIYALISIILTYATGVLGLVMVLMIVIAGLQYVVSNGDPNITKAAKDRIRNVFTGFVLFVFMWGILQLLLPPGSSVLK